MKTLIALCVLLCGFSVQAEIPGLQHAYLRTLGTARQKISKSGLISQSPSDSCHQQALTMRSDGNLNITVAFGYMDVSGGQDFNDSGNNLYSVGQVLDIDAKNALENIFLGSCSRGRQACGFKKRGARLVKTIRDRWTNQKINVNVKLLSPALSGNNAVNSTSNRARQNQRSQNVESQFLSALRTDDAVIYAGHARSGGGPDFYPPVLTSSGSVNYSHYRNEKRGIRAMLSSLSQAKRQAPVIGLLACKSTGLFANSVRSYAPDSLLISADDLFDYNDILPTAYATVEGIVSQQCSNEFTQIVKIRPSSSRFLRLFY